ncbi:hypothetical protein J1N35_032577 [Gossypium stocksii]|uniref:Uncharacterized protein n=1 Tax=Gossypium stocksii TaxID=47602 RepID=A0A9D3V3T0_9ROSI|nr:hypothetical protein J1N35_032577 [Gossypium stocksii]
MLKKEEKSTPSSFLSSLTSSTLHFHQIFFSFILVHFPPFSTLSKNVKRSEHQVDKGKEIAKERRKNEGFHFNQFCCEDRFEVLE